MISAMKPLVAAAVAAGLATAVGAQSARYMDDFAFVTKTVKDHGAAVRSKKIDWEAVSAAFRPRFAACKDDAGHVRLIMELLATCRDSHTDVTRTSVPRDQLPQKFDGLYGGGLWLGFDAGKFVLKGVMKGHALGDQLPLGSMLVAIEGEPAWIAMERERRRVARFLGVSSDHSFFASLSNRFLPFGEKKDLACVFLRPDGEMKKVDVPRWGPGGKAFSPFDAFLPEGLSYAEGACSKLLAGPDGMKLGYLKVTGSMDAETVRAFDAAFDALKGMDALLLDCRLMGGGGDAEAWRMCGRLFSKETRNGDQEPLVPTGAWQFDGPVVMLQDESEVSSAETFTWALSETGRVLSVGRATGGWGIIPRGYELPSGLASFRLGVNDRATPIKGVHTEGVGWPADVTIPLGPVIAALDDAPRRVGVAALACRRAGATDDETRKAFRALADGDPAPLRALAKKVGAKAKEADLERLAKIFVDDVKAEAALEQAACRAADVVVPEAALTSKRLPRLAARAKAAGAASLATDLDKTAKSLAAEAAAQEAWRALPEPFDLTAPATKAWLAKCATSKLAAHLRTRSTK
jgi:hypothetical protein